MAYRRFPPIYSRQVPFVGSGNTGIVFAINCVIPHQFCAEIHALFSTVRRHQAWASEKTPLSLRLAWFLSQSALGTLVARIHDFPTGGDTLMLSGSLLTLTWWVLPSRKCTHSASSLRGSWAESGSWQFHHCPQTSLMNPHSLPRHDLSANGDFLRTPQFAS